MYQMSQGYGGSSCGSNYSSGCRSACGYSRLESIASTAGGYRSENHVSYSISAPQNYNQSFIPMPINFIYNSTEKPAAYQNNPNQYQFFKPETNYHFIPDQFLTGKNLGGFVGKAEEVKEFVEEAFQTIFNQPFPSDIKIVVCEEKDFKKLALHPGTIGLSINRSKLGLLSEIFVKNDFLARVMLTIGHELGHVLSEPLESPQDEEAKAYAFSLAWMKTIKENNIANLKETIVTERPAENGVHNIGFALVEKLIQAGNSAWEVYLNILRKIISSQPERFITDY